MWHLARVEILSCFKMNKIAIFVLENKCAHLRVGIFLLSCFSADGSILYEACLFRLFVECIYKTIQPLNYL